MRDFTSEEICIALNQMPPLKTLGPNGFAACLYQENWAVMGEEVCGVILNFLNSSLMYKDLNSTYIALVPKIQNLYWVSEF